MSPTPSPTVSYTVTIYQRGAEWFARVLSVSTGGSITYRSVLSPPQPSEHAARVYAGALITDQPNPNMPTS